MTLPLLVSVPHAGLEVPPGLQSQCLLTPAQIAADGDVGAAVIYALADHVEHFVTTRIARAVLDMNRAVDDFHKDGIVKTHTCWDEPIWRHPLDQVQIARLLAEHHTPYHAQLTRLAGQVKLGVDCHTMAAFGPPVGPDPGRRRPLVCLGDGAGAACPRPWIEALRDCFVDAFGTALRDEVTVNVPFAGGHITRSHGREMPWVQIELSRTDEVSIADKRRAVLHALSAWCALAL